MTLQVVFGNDYEELARATAAASAYLQRQAVRSEAVYALELVLEELGTNIIKYGFEDSGRHQIELRIERVDALIHVRLIDSGRPFDPRGDGEPAPSESLATVAIGGRGLGMVRRRTASLDWHHVDGKNVVEFSLPA